MPQKKAEDEDLTFLVTTNPFATSAADKRRVRSAAALKSWPERRKKVSRKLRDSEEGEETSDFIEQGPSSPSSSIRISSLDPRPSNTSEDVPFYYEVRHPGTATSITHSIQINSPPTVAEPCPRQKTPELPCKCWRCDAQRHQSLVRQKRPRVDLQSRKRLADGSLKFSGGLALITPPSSPEPEQPVSSRADPFNCYPVPYHPWFDGILHHMLTIYAPRGWPALKITREQGIKWEWFMTQHALAEPALFYVRLLFGSGDLIRLKVLKPEITYWLRAQAIKAINQALEDPARAISDPMILAVGRIALHESMYGDRHAANMIHRPAVRRTSLLHHDEISLTRESSNAE